MYKEEKNKISKVMTLIYFHYCRMVYPYVHEVFKLKGAKETDDDIRDSEKLLNVFKVALIYQLEAVTLNLSKDEDVSKDAKWNKKYQVEVSQVAKMHAIYMTARAFKEIVATFDVNAKTKHCLDLLFKVYIIDNILRYGELALMNNYISSQQMYNLYNYSQEIAVELRPDLIALGEVVTISEEQYLRPQFSHSKTDYKEVLFHNAKHAPLNKKTKLDNFDKCVVPLRQKLKNFARM